MLRQQPGAGGQPGVPVSSPAGRGLRLAWGAGIATLYLVAAAVSPPRSPDSSRIFYDGSAPPPPYRWVRPPLERARDNQPPEPGTGDVPFGPEGLSPLSVTTGDGQAAAIFDEKTVAPEAGQSAVRVRITPLDPRAVAAPPPGVRFDSNAYRIDVRYVPSGKPVVLRAPITVVLRYASGGVRVLQASASGWIAHDTTTYLDSLEVVAHTQTLGVFAAVAPKTLPYAPKASWWVYVVAGGSVIGALIIGYRYAPRMRAYRRRKVGVPQQDS